MNSLGNGINVSLNKPTNDNLSIALVVLLSDCGNSGVLEGNSLWIFIGCSSELSISSNRDALLQAVLHSSRLLHRRIEFNLIGDR